MEKNLLCNNNTRLVSYTYYYIQSDSPDPFFQCDNEFIQILNFGMYKDRIFRSMRYFARLKKDDKNLCFTNVRIEHPF